MGAPISRRFSAQRLRGFSPREGTELARAQKEVEDKCHEREEEREKEDLAKIEEERKLDKAEREGWGEGDRRQGDDEQPMAWESMEELEVDADDEKAKEDEESIDEEERMNEDEAEEDKE